MKIKLITAALTMGLSVPLLAQDTYWALKDNKVLNTKTGKICTQRANEWPIIMDAFPGVYTPSIARGVCDAGGHCLFTFTDVGIHEIDNLSTYNTINGITGGTAAFQVNNGKCKQYYLVTTRLSIKYHNLDIIKIDASAITNAVNNMTLDQINGMSDQGLASVLGGSSRHAVCVTPIPGGGHYIYYAVPNEQNFATYTSIWRYSVSDNGTINNIPSIALANQTMPLIGTGPGAKIKASQDGTTLAYQGDNQNLVFADAATGYIINSIPMTADIYGLEQVNVTVGSATERRWYICADNKISYVVESASTAPVMLQSFPAGLKTDLALGRNGKVFYATNGGYMNYFDPNSTTFNTVQVSNIPNLVFSANGWYSLGNLVTGENNSTADAYDELGDYTISGNTTWDFLNNPATNFNQGPTSLLRIKGNLIIEKGADATIRDMKIELGPESKVIIEASEENVAWAGYLTLNNTEITAHRTGCDNGNNMWDGVKVCGRGNAYDQVYLTGNTHLGRHATIRMVNNSTLSYAHTAIQNFGPGNDEESSNMSGGIIIGEWSKFKNNETSVLYAPFLHYVPNTQNVYPYRSSFDKCSFEVSEGLPTEFKGFVKGTMVDRVAFRGCSFLNTSGKNTESNYGIWGTDFGINLDGYSYRGSLIRNSFENLKYGINDERVSEYVPNVDIRNADFINNDIGIHTKAIDFPIAAGNTFKIPDLTLDKNLESAIGIYINTGTGYTVRDNLFTGMKTQGLKPNTGVVIANTGGDNNIVHSNKYENLTMGNVSNYQNRGVETGLTFQCNNYVKNYLDEGASGLNPMYDGISQLQGNYYLPAGNQFYGSAYHIHLDPAQVAASQYFWYNSAPIENPYMFSGNVSTIATPNSNSCIYPALPGNTTPYYGEGAKPAPGTKENSLLEQIATASNVKEKMELLKNWKSPYSDMMQADILVASGKGEEARKLYKDIKNRYQLTGKEVEAFERWGQQLLDIAISLQEQQKLPKNLNHEQVKALELVAEKGTLWTQKRAQNWLTLYDGRIFKQEILLPKISEIAKTFNIEENAETSPVIYPNPVHDFLTIQYKPRTGQGSTIQIFNVIGKLILKSNLSGESEQRIDMKNVPAGIYLYQVIENGKVIYQGKVSKA
jgi:hypothetical protein